MLTASTVEDKALISGKETFPLNKGCAVLVVPLKKEITMKIVSSLTLSSMMQDCYLYCTAHTRRTQSSSNDLHKGAIADCFEC